MSFVQATVASGNVNIIPDSYGGEDIPDDA